jgi:hypothetical protein
MNADPAISRQPAGRVQRRPVPNRQLSWKWFLSCVTVYCLALIGTIRNTSLVRDEGFSAYMACQSSVARLWSALKAADSSDLQTAMHALYLHWWVGIFGASEYALRASNIPFILLFCCALVWTSWRVFHSRWLWIVPAVYPLLWTTAGLTRAYFGLVAMSMLCLASLLGYLDTPTYLERRILPWLTLSTFLLGTTLDMLMLLTAVPMLVVLLLRHRKHPNFRFADWRLPFQTLVVPFCLWMVYLKWTFARGTAYDYFAPTFRLLSSTILQFVAITGYRTKDRFDILTSPNLWMLSLATVAVFFALGLLLYIQIRSEQRLRFFALLCGLGVGFAEMLGLAFVTGQQFEVRHMIEFFPFLACLVMAGYDARWNPTGGRVAAAILACVWIVADYRLLRAPDYRLEDYRTAVARTLDLHHSLGGFIVMVADPATSAYYGLAAADGKSCYPFRVDCESAMRSVPWTYKASAEYAFFWTEPEIVSFLNRQSASREPTVLLYKNWFIADRPFAWRSLLDEHRIQPSAQYEAVGLTVYVFR